ncbi:flagellar hook-associated protein FlgK [Bacillus sp. OK048]|uniref:flagellar hook-associated protein FlgK n=1 Tax=Bacillus sp. OK048 TaxID=1882761 RepID=UPI0008886EAA|nr:flagellar hook-associated protein FlgK [Bacillus sp. OK048]SDM90749.1 flagellar hook-associated protein 1 FlgK [Bacillus sp. OK048]
MYSTFHGLEIGKRAILSQQTALSTTGHNIANANTKGYTRQEAVLQATRPLASPNPNNGTLPMQMGTGVEVSEFRRIRESYLDNQFQNEQQKAGYWEAKANSLSQLEDVFNELSDSGLSSSLNRFWQGLQELSKQPESISARVVVVANGKEVASNLNQIFSGIADYEKSLTDQLQVKANEVNAAANEIATLNQQIAQNIGAGKQPNDLLDRRDLLLDNLSKIANIEVTPTVNGKVDVSISGVKLVEGNSANTFTVNPQDGGAKIAGNLVELKGGEIKGLLETLGYMDATGTTVGRIPELKTSINLLATTIAESMNAIHAGDQARNLDDVQARSEDPTAPLEKLLFFVDKDDPTQPPKDAGNIIINPALVDYPAKVAAASSDNIGDGSNATLMSDVFFQKIDIGGTNTTIGDFYKKVIGQLGTDVLGAQLSGENATAMVQMVDNRRQSVSGVSIDEEMTNMIRYQQAYNAAARYVSAVNDLLNTLINGMK